MQNARIAFIGLGVMGNGMVSNLLKAGYPVQVFTRTASSAKGAIDQGAVWRDSIGAVVEGADVVISIVGYPKDVEEVYLSQDGILAHAKPGSYLIDMTTSSPQLAQRIAKEAAEKSVHALDAPVSGGDIGAREGRLSIMVGGAASDFDHVLPVLQSMGTNVVYQGPAGSGQYTKMCNQIVIATGMIGICESLVYAKQAGLDPTTVLKSIGSGAAGSWGLNNLGPRIIKNDFAPGFFVKHFIKDMGIAIESAEALGLFLPGLALAKSMYDQLAIMGESESGTQALYKWFGVQAQ